MAFESRESPSATLSQQPLHGYSGHATIEFARSVVAAGEFCVSNRAKIPANPRFAKCTIPVVQLRGHSVTIELEVE